jgi:hypothetical protein
MSRERITAVGESTALLLPKGVRDAGALEAALTAAENRAYYEQTPLLTCAATYA